MTARIKKPTAWEMYRVNKERLERENAALREVLKEGLDLYAHQYTYSGEVDGEMIGYLVEHPSIGSAWFARGRDLLAPTRDAQ